MKSKLLKSRGTFLSSFVNVQTILELIDLTSTRYQVEIKRIDISNLDFRYTCVV